MVQASPHGWDLIIIIVVVIIVVVIIIILLIIIFIIEFPSDEVMCKGDTEGTPQEADGQGMTAKQQVFHVLWRMLLGSSSNSQSRDSLTVRLRGDLKQPPLFARVVGVSLVLP